MPDTCTIYTSIMLVTIIAIAVSYLIGSFCSAVFISRLCHLPDPRLEGSKNPGATNVLRLSGKKYAVLVLLTDILKGLLPLIIAHIFGAPSLLLGWMALAAVLGHIFPIFYDFQGGKGVATALGALIGLNLWIGLLCCLIWLLSAKISRYSSLSSIIAVSSAPILVFLFSSSRGATFPMLLMACCILYKHKENIIRLRNHEESQIKM